MRISQWWHPGSWFWNWSNNSFQDHFIQHFFNLFPIFYRDFALGMLHWRKGRVSPDGIGPGHVTYSVKRVGKGSFQCYNVPDLSYGVRGSCQGWMHLRAVENWLLGHREGTICQSGASNGLGRGGQFGSGMHFWVLKWLKLPTLTSSLLSMVLERLEVNGSSLLREVASLFPWQLAGGLHCCPCWTPLSLQWDLQRSLV